MRQTLTILGINLGRLVSRPGLALVNILGVASAVAVMISLLSMSAGIVRMSNVNADPARVLVLSGAASSEYLGAIPAASVLQIAQTPGVARDARGQPRVQPAALVGVELLRKGSDERQTAPLRGTGPQGWAMGGSARIIEGRMYRPGLYEVIVGKGVANQFEGIEVGRQVQLRGRPWTVVGVFEDNGGLGENAIVGDVETIMTAFDRRAYQSVAVVLQDPSKFEAFKLALEANPQLFVTAEHYSEYYKRQTDRLAGVLAFVGIFIGGVMALGVVFGALTTMYAAVDSRAREYATLRALGYRGGSLLLSVLVESVLVALPGLVLGTAAAVALFGGQRASVMGLSFMTAFTPGLIGAACVITVAIGVLGGFAPAVRAARLPVASALRAT